MDAEYLQKTEIYGLKVRSKAEKENLLRASETTDRASEHWLMNEQERGRTTRATKTTNNVYPDVLVLQKKSEFTAENARNRFSRHLKIEPPG